LSAAQPHTLQLSEVASLREALAARDQRIMGLEVSGGWAQHGLVCASESANLASFNRMQASNWMLLHDGNNALKYPLHSARWTVPT